MKTQRECAICYDQKKSSDIDCLCNICTDCYQAYTKIQINESWTSDGNHLSFKCPGSCSNTIYFDHLLLLAKKNDFSSAIMDELFKKYCQKAHDVIACPNSNCNLYYLQPCRWKCNILCEQCNSLLLQRKELIFTQIFQNWSSKLYEFLTTQECPRCQVKISKNGGCSHMTCRFCKYEFCWDCKHSCREHDWNICIQHNLTILLLQYLLAYQILYQLGLHIYLIAALTYIFSLTYWYDLDLQSFVLNNLILALFWLLANSLKQYQDPGQKNKRMVKHRIIFSSVVSSILCFIAYSIVEMQRSIRIISTIWDWIWYMIKEMIFSLVVIIILTILNQIYSCLFYKTESP